MLATTRDFEMDSAWPEDFQAEFETLIDERYFDNGLTPTACCAEAKLADYLPQLRAHARMWDAEDHERAFWLVKPMQERAPAVPPLVIIGGDIVDGFYRLRAMELGEIASWPAIILPDPGF
jgi:hypothetical protein